MRTILKMAACLTLGAGLACGQQPTFHDQFLDHLTGNWVLQGTIMGKENTHDVAAEWVLGHQYVRIHEVSREKNSQGQPDYEAMAFVGWDQPAAEYVCAWLDTYGGMTPATFGRGKRNGDEIHFLFKDKDGVFHTRFVYHPEAGNWEWRMDSEEKGTMKPFARVKLTRK
ncbi:MAG: hypothetical protein ABSA59_23805 [Terriglobia bacterium]